MDGEISLSSDQQRVLDRYAVRLRGILEKDDECHRLADELKTTGMTLMGISFDIQLVIRNTPEAGQRQKRTFYADARGGITFSQEDDAKFRQHFNVSLNPPGQK